MERREAWLAGKRMRNFFIRCLSCVTRFKDKQMVLSLWGSIPADSDYEYVTDEASCLMVCSGG